MFATVESQKSSFLTLLATCIGLMLSACAPGGDASEPGAGDVAATGEQARCEEAAAHLEMCFGEEAQASLSCDEASARSVLGASCEDLTQSSRGGKADSLCNPLLWWTWSSCSSGGGGGGGGSSSQGVSFGTALEMCYDSICYEITGGGRCVLVTLENAAGEELSRAYTGRLSSARFNDVALEDGEYYVRVHRRDGETAQMMTSLRGSIGLDGRADAVRAVQVEGGKVNKIPKFLVTADERELLTRCVSLSGDVTSTCGAAPMSVDETEWSWLVELTGSNDAGEYASIKRPFVRWDEPTQSQFNRFWFDDLMAGEYTVSFIEVDVPSWARKNNPDHDELKRRYATGRVLEEAFTVSGAEAPAKRELGEYLLSHEKCR